MPGKTILVKLVSDFYDFYDHMFDRSGVVFERMSQTTLSRRGAFAKMLAMGLHIPICGEVIALAPLLKQLAPRMVVYLDQYKHRGEGKRLVPLTEAYELYPDKFASVYLPTSPISYRYLRIGHHVAWLKYVSDDQWRSNCGDVHISQEYGLWPQIAESDPQETPLLAVDFVKWHGIPYAVDWNTSPGLRGTPIEQDIPASDIVRDIKAWFERSISII